MRILRKVKHPGPKDFEIHDVEIELTPSDIGFIGGNPADYQEARQVMAMLIREAELMIWATLVRAQIISPDEYQKRLAGFSDIPDALTTRAPIEPKYNVWVLDQNDPNWWHAFAPKATLALCGFTPSGQGIGGPTMEEPDQTMTCRTCRLRSK